MSENNKHALCIGGQAGRPPEPRGSSRPWMRSSGVLPTLPPQPVSRSRSGSGVLSRWCPRPAVLSSDCSRFPYFVLAFRQGWSSTPFHQRQAFPCSARRRRWSFSWLGDAGLQGVTRRHVGGRCGGGKGEATACRQAEFHRPQHAIPVACHSVDVPFSLSPCIPAWA